MKSQDRISNYTSPAEIGRFLLDELPRGQPPWKPGWEKTLVSPFPHNAVTNRFYGGWWNVLVLLLTMRSLDTRDGGFLTQAQAKRLGVEINDDASPTFICFTDSNWQIYRTYTLFSVSETVGFKRTHAMEHSWDPVERIERLVRNSSARIVHDRVLDVPHYDPWNDSIYMPNQERFLDASMYYQALLHELAHWTGHSSRLDRDLKLACESRSARAREELRAEITSYLLGLEYGIGHDPRRNLSYLEYWSRMLQVDENEIQQAASEAMKIKRFIAQFDTPPN